MPRALAGSVALLGLAGLAGLAAVGCAISVDASPTEISVPDDVFPSGTSEGGGSVDRPGSPATTAHAVFFVREGHVVEVTRNLAAPVYLEGPLNSLLSGPTDDEALEGLASAIPSGTELVDVSLRRNNVVAIHLNEIFFSVEGEQRIRATAQLVLTGSALVDNAQGVLFLLSGQAQFLPDGEGAIDQVGDATQPRPLRIADFSNLAEAAASDANSGASGDE